MSAPVRERPPAIESPPEPTRRPSPTVIESFNYAFQGVVHALRTHRNMRVHVVIAAVVLIAAIVLGVSRLELIALLLSITFVLVAEMLNTAIESAIDVATTSFDPLAKLAKEIGVADLSMGMSADYTTAIEFGATHVRVGSAIFGHRG